MEYANVKPPRRRGPFLGPEPVFIEIIELMESNNSTGWIWPLYVEQKTEEEISAFKGWFSKNGCSAEFEPMVEDEIKTHYTYDFLGQQNGVYQHKAKKFIGYKITVRRD